MKLLRYFPDGPSAQLARSLLAANGIDAFVGDPPDTFSVKGIRLMVPDDAVEAANGILDNVSDDLALPDDWEPPAEPGGEEEVPPA